MMSDDEESRLKTMILRQMEATINVPGDPDITLEGLFPEQFMRENTEYDNFDSFLEESPCEYDPAADVSEILGPELDDFVLSHSDFGSWQQMRQQAEVKWMNEHLG